MLDSDKHAWIAFRLAYTQVIEFTCFSPQNVQVQLGAKALQWHLQLGCPVLTY